MTNDFPVLPRQVKAELLAKGFQAIDALSDEEMADLIIGLQMIERHLFLSR